MTATKKKKAQSITEFSAGMVVLCLILYGMVEIFRWGMMDLAERRFDHDRSFSNRTLSTESQLNPNFHDVRPMDTLWYRR